ncbi:ATP synthase subunit I [Piscirickettsia salmonis]|uniref:F0F1 ATP synthase subunit I n=1 Tax=Piscirickettsia salmonis TaxID=1238 RepID=A0A9Q5YH08_PISSA|nr:ATP synthase subunit I [Piscirickettsia salmonis]RNC79244.1 hypothetical protein DA717_00055 [Piscirickettsiaceae bacterium NZ-RLO2]ALA23481.1 ATP synthase I chain family protein [Piscirickettsia salmonis]APS43944.1 ATP synthase subunit I [Piscirickettsia salmonis]APS47299.1 ATP synthase subunit I [Piscirickettsia salmonis]APS51263.1 ATP synthase subunit I [Piscirickettsia salmonis]
MQPKQRMYKIPLIQLALSVLFSIIAWCISQQWGLSVFLGGISVILPSLYFIWRYLRRQSKDTVSSAKSVLTDFYLTVFSKMVMSIVVLIALLMICVHIFQLPVIPFIVGYAINQVVSSLLPLVYKTESVGGA